MCLIIQKPADVQVPEDVLLTAWENNYDGMGIMTTRNNRVKVHRILPETADDVLKLYNRFKDEDIGIHFRWATHGLVNKKMAHPFKIFHNEPQGQDLYMMHNGVFNRVGDWKQGASDTWHFVNEFLQPWLKKYSCEILKEDEFQEMLGSYIGFSNKLLFLDSEGAFTTINKKAGAEKDGFWISNTYSLNPSYRFGSSKKKDPYNYENDDYYYDSYAKTPMSDLPQLPGKELPCVWAKNPSYLVGFSSTEDVHTYKDEISFAEFNSRDLGKRNSIDWDDDKGTYLNEAGDVIFLPDLSTPKNDNKIIEAKETPECLEDVYDATVNYLSEGLYGGKTVEEIFYLADADFWTWFTKHLDIAGELMEDLMVYYMKETE